MTNDIHAHEAGASLPANDEAPADSTARGFRNQEQDASSHFHAIGTADQAALSVEGEDYPREYLARLHGGIAEPGELAVILAFLTGEMLHGACRLIERMLGVPHA